MNEELEGKNEHDTKDKKWGRKKKTGVKMKESRKINKLHNVFFVNM
jgi:hypothetical protein